MSGARDALTRRHGTTPVDKVAWGEAEPGWRLANPARGTVCRPNPGKDTNTYLDWTQDSQGTPGTAGCGK